MIQENPFQPPPVAAPQPKRSYTTRIVLLVLLVVVVGGMALLFRARAKATAAAAVAASSAAANRTIPVLTAEVVRRDVPVLLEGLGNVTAFYTVTVKTQVDGRLDKVLFTEGQHVKKGDVLAQIDPRPFAIQLAVGRRRRSRATRRTLKNAHLNLERYKTLAQQNLIPQQQVDDQQAMVDQLEAQVRSDQATIDTARLNLDYARIISPIDGVTGVRLVDPGNVVHAADPTGIVVVTQLDPIAVLFTLPEDDLPRSPRRMARGHARRRRAQPRRRRQRSARGKLVAHRQPDQPGDGDDPAQGDLRRTPTTPLWPNQFVKARLRLSTRHEGALVVPASARAARAAGDVRLRRRAPDRTAASRPVDVERHAGRGRGHHERASRPASRSSSTARRSSGPARRSRRSPRRRQPPGRRDRRPQRRADVGAGEAQLRDGARRQP